MKKISDYNKKKLCECFNCYSNNDTDITISNIELTSTDESSITVIMERGKYLSYFGTRFAKIDENGIIHVFKDFL